MRSLSLLFSLFILSQPLAAEEISCRDQAKRFTAKKVANAIHKMSKSCVESAKAAGLANGELYDASADGSVQAYGVQNYVVIDSGSPKLNVIAGKMPGLNHVMSVSVSEDGKDVAVLNKRVSGEKEILLFKSDLLGNVAPMRAIFDDSITGVTQVSFTGNGDSVLILDDLKNEIFSISSNADSRSSNPLKVVELSSIFKTTKRIKQVEGIGAEVVVLTDDNQLKSVSMQGASNWVLNLSDKGVTNAETFEYLGSDFNFYDGESTKAVRHPASE